MTLGKLPGLEEAMLTSWFRWGREKTKALKSLLARAAILSQWLYQNAWRLHKKSAQALKPKILYVDTLSEPHALTNVNGIQSAYERVGIVEPFDYRRLAKSLGPGLMNELLCCTALLFRPDLIHLGKSELIDGKSVRKIKRKTEACIIHFYGDFRWEPQPWVVDIGRYADLTLLYHKDAELIKRHRDLGVSPIGFWWVGTDPDVMYPRDLEKRHEVVFMANNADFLEGHQQRRQLINEIVNAGIDLHLYGDGWEYLAGPQNVHLHPFVNDDEFAEACSVAKITLGFSAVNDVQMYASWRRPLNSMACGAFHLTRYFSGLETVFENRKHLVWFHSIPEAIELIQYYLVHNEEREAIARAGRQEVLTHHTWDHRVAEMFQYFEQWRLADQRADI
jgi:hypothetical protein